MGQVAMYELRKMFEIHCLRFSPFKCGNAHDIETRESFMPSIGFFAIRATSAVLLALIPCFVAFSDLFYGQTFWRILLVCEE